MHLAPRQLVSVIEFSMSINDKYKLSSTMMKMIILMPIQSKDFYMTQYHWAKKTEIDRRNIHKPTQDLLNQGVIEVTGKVLIEGKKSLIKYGLTRQFVQDACDWYDGKYTKRIIKGQPVAEDTDYELDEDVLDIPIEEFQGVTMDEDYCKNLE